MACTHDTSRSCDLIFINSTSFAIVPSLFLLTTITLDSRQSFKKDHSCESCTHQTSESDQETANMEPSATRRSTPGRTHTTGSNPVYLPVDRTRATAYGRNDTSSPGGYTPMSRWTSEGTREQPWNAVREVSATSSACRRGEYAGSADSVRRGEDRDSVIASWGSETGRR